MNRKRPRGEEGYAGVGEYTVRGEVRRQLNRDVAEGDVTSAPTDRKQLMADDGSSSTKLGQTQNLSKRARLNPQFAGAGPGAPGTAETRRPTGSPPGGRRR